MQDEIVEGQVLDGKYRIDRVLGRGGMGVVVAARHLVLDEVVAIKCLAHEVLSSGEAVARFEREARAALKIKSEHVVRVLDFGRLPSGSPYMVMEYLDGEDLSHWLEARGPLPVELAVDFIVQAGVALAGAHVAGIVHRDIKPANLFCTLGNDGHPVIKVLDFGISKLTEASVKDSGLSVTKTSAVMGSPLYMSPEQVQNSKDVDARTDIWSLGVVLFELLGGRTPFAGETFGEVAVKIAIQPTPPLAELRGDVPAGFDGVMARCLAKDRAHRFPNVAELASALAPYASRRGQATVERILGIQLAISSPGSFASAHSASGSSRSAHSASGSFASARSTPGTLPSAPSAGISASGTAAPEIPETVSPWSGSPPKRSSRGALIGTLSVLAVALAIFGVFLWRRGATRSEPATAIAVAAPEVTTPAAPAPPPPPTVTVTPASAQVPPVPPTSSAPEPALTPAATQTAPRGRPGRPAAPTREPAPTPAARPAPPKPDCDPPYTLDAQGRKKFKPECFLK